MKNREHDYELKLFAGSLKDQKQLMESSSGGAFTAFSNVAFSHSGVIACALYNYSTLREEFSLIDSCESRNKARGSMYVQAFVGNIYNDIVSYLNSNLDKHVFFFGTGCQAAALKRIAINNNIDDRITIIDIICHGVPSPKFWNSYFSYISAQVGTVKKVSFKDKRNGWLNPFAYALTDHGEVELKEFINIYYGNYITRPACSKCPYCSFERTSDITIGDFWGINDVYPEYYNKNGTSLILVHSEKGERLLNLATKDLNIFSVEIDKCIQPNLVHPTESRKTRSVFWKDFNNHSIEFILKKYGHGTMIDKVKIKAKRIMKSVWGGGIIYFR